LASSILAEVGFATVSLYIVHEISDFKSCFSKGFVSPSL